MRLNALLFSLVAAAGIAAAAPATSFAQRIHDRDFYRRNFGRSRVEEVERAARIRERAAERALRSARQAGERAIQRAEQQERLRDRLIDREVARRATMSRVHERLAEARALRSYRRRW